LGGGWSTPRPGRFTPRKRYPIPLYRRLGGHQDRSGRVRKIAPPPGFDPQAVQPVASRYTDCAIPAYVNIVTPYYTFFPTSPVTCSLPSPNTFLSTLFYNTYCSVKSSMATRAYFTPDNQSAYKYRAFTGQTSHKLPFLYTFLACTSLCSESTLPCSDLSCA
jgi:hypothetical protein